MTTTIFRISGSPPGAKAVRAALEKAGIEVTETGDWAQARQALAASEDALVVADAQSIARLAEQTAPREVPRDAARVLSHDLRTPLSAMAGWLHLMESGALDEAGLKRAIGRLRGNIEDQVRSIERFLGASQEGH
jgi:signal transduction histidine kinase